MGGKPVGTFLSTALPKSIPDGFTEEFIRGYKDISDRFNCPLLGGDTTAAKDRLCISVTVLGSCGAGQSLKRSGARPGDLVCVTGTLGDSAAGLKLVLERQSDGRGSHEAPDTERILVDRHYRPMPRIAEGLRLAATTGVNACMDISDGIGSDLRHILEASGVTARVDVRSLPLSAELRDLCARRGWDPAELALSGGEDYELLFTCRPGTPVSIPHTVIGEILAAPEGSETAGPVIIWEGTDKDFTGFRHF
jgi:thiamine-monophosphate kinase